MTNGRTRSDDVLPDEEMLEADKDVTPPHGDELRSEIAFGRTDRYANADGDAHGEQAAPEEPVQDPEGSRDTRHKR
jgi:hypothetical protein